MVVKLKFCYLLLKIFCKFYAMVHYQYEIMSQNEHLNSAFLPAFRSLARKLNSYIQRQVIHDSVVGIEQ